MRQGVDNARDIKRIVVKENKRTTFKIDKEVIFEGHSFTDESWKPKLEDTEKIIAFN